MELKGIARLVLSTDDETLTSTPCIDKRPFKVPFENKMQTTPISQIPLSIALASGEKHSPGSGQDGRKFQIP